MFSPYLTNIGNHARGHRNQRQIDVIKQEIIGGLDPNIDFSLVNRVTKKLILAIEVDGYAYHNKDTRQSQRDVMKNHILDTYRIPYVRFSTTGSNEKQILIDRLKSLMTVSEEELQSTERQKQSEQKVHCMYYCHECKKLFKASGEGKRIKCSVCKGVLYDMHISESDYNALDAEGKKEIKRAMIT